MEGAANGHGDGSRCGMGAESNVMKGGERRYKEKGI